MADVPKIVHHRLRAATPEQRMLERAHPEADVLTAFAEQALSAVERDGVLQHLALCADCRDVVALALPAMEMTVTPVETESEAVRAHLPDKARTNWFAWASLNWANLRWAALAAGIAIAVLVVRPGLEHLAKPSPPASSVASHGVAPAVPPDSSAQVAPGMERSIEEKGVEAKTGTASARSEFSGPKMRATTPAPQAWPRPLVAANGKKESATAAQPAATPPPGTVAFDAPRNTTEATDVSEAASAVIAAPTTEADLMAWADAPPIEKAKPALEDTEVNEPPKTTIAGAQAMSLTRHALLAKAAAPRETTLDQNATWMIAAGILQRSLDGGQRWQTALRADHALLCYANPNRGPEVWAGGQAGTLLHSTDGGTTWSAVSVSFKGQPLSSDVTHIDVTHVDVRGPAAIVLATDNHETWSSADGGKTWEKK